VTVSAVLHLDVETRSTVDLKKAGKHRYFEHPSTALWNFSYKFESGKRGRWVEGQPMPADVVAHVAAGLPVKAHNAAFEIGAWNTALPRQVGPLPPLRPEQCDCTMARAAILALPLSLGDLAKVFGAPEKDQEGHRLMMKMCRPRSVAEDGTVTWWNDPALIERQALYCDRDVDAEEGVDKLLPPLSADEREVWLLDQEINDRGVQLDVPFISKALAAVEEAKKRADKEIWRLTNGAVTACTQVAKIIEWLNTRGIIATSIAKGEVEELILRGHNLGDPVIEQVLLLRRAAAKSSTSKFKAMLTSVCADGRGRGALQYSGAGTGRWAGRLWQPQNLPRVDEDRDLPDVTRTLRLLEKPLAPRELIDAMECLGMKPLETLSKCLRPMLIAAPGHHLVGGDYSNIEGRLNAWMAGEHWKMDAFRAYDNGTGPDLYKVTAAKITGKRIEDVTKFDRQASGKVSELACGYQGGPGAYVTMGANYGVKPWEVAAVAKQQTDADTWLATAERYNARDSRGLELEVWTGLRVIVDSWRASNAAITKSWWELQDAAIEAVSAPGVVVPVLGGKAKYLVAGGYLLCQLPSGRALSYASPELKRVKSGRQNRDGSEQYKWQVTYWGQDSTTKKWTRQYLYGGLQCENIVQAAARDVMVCGMRNAKKAGFALVLTVHDELLAEVLDSQHHLNAAYMNSAMAVLPTWATGLPLTAGTWEDKRYIK
jgi:DNA polymerase